jgi:hypothetical protein
MYTIVVFSGRSGKNKDNWSWRMIKGKFNNNWKDKNAICSAFKYDSKQGARKTAVSIAKNFAKAVVVVDGSGVLLFSNIVKPLAHA